MRSRPVSCRMMGGVMWGITALALGLLAAAACAQPEVPTPTLQPTDTPVAAPTLEPTDRSVPPPTTRPTVAPSPASVTQPSDTPEPAPTTQSAVTPEAIPTDRPADAPLDCAALFPTNTPNPDRPASIRSFGSQFWNVHSYEEAECVTGFPIYVPANLPDGFMQNDSISVSKMGSASFESRFVEHGWHLPGDTVYGFRLSQHSSEFGINGEPAIINGALGERHLLPARPPDFPPLLTLLWKQDGYWFTVSGFLDGPITEEFLLKVAASLHIPDEGSR